MTDKEFLSIAKGLKSVYADPKYIADDFAVEIWFNLLKDLPYEVCTMAVQSYMQTQAAPPTPADIRKLATKITSPESEDMSELDAWSMVRKAVRNGIYNAEVEYEKLPEIVQKTLGSPERIREMAQIPTDELEGVEQSHFVRNYRTQLQIHKQDMQMNESLRESIRQSRTMAEPSIEQEKPLEIETTVEHYEIPAEIETELARFRA